MYMKNKIKFFYCILFLFIVHNVSTAQFSPSFQNFSTSEYNAGNQNWGLSKSKDGKLYVANNEGLLEFDGLKWTLWELPNKTTIRSVLAYDDKIFIGSYEEFGYWEKDVKGNLQYNSLSNLMDTNKILNEEFWQIVSYNGSIVFRSFSAIYLYQDNVIKRISTASTPMSCNVVEDKLYISTLQNGIFMLKDEELFPFINDNVLQNTKIISISPLRDNEMLIATSLKGCFRLTDNKLMPWKSEINFFIKQHQLNSFSKLNNGNMIFGTIKNGIYETDEYGDIIFHINKENGLINNTILGMNVDPSNKLWLGLDNGIASIDLDTNHSFYNDISGKLGAVYDVIKYEDIIYIGSNTGLYFLDGKNTLQFIEGSQGQVWDLKEINGKLFCGHNNGTYIVKKNRLILISSHTGGWVIKKVPEQKDIFIQGTYTGLVSYKMDKGELKVKHLGKTTIPIKHLVFEDQYTAWAAHAYKGLYRIKFDKNYDTIVDIKNYANKGLLSDYNVRVYNLKNNICFKTNRGWQKYESILDSIIPHELLNENFGKNTYIISEDDGDRLAFKNDNFISFGNLSNDDDKIFIADRYFKNRQIVGNENFSKINDSIYALNLIDGFMLVNESNFSKNYILEKPTIESIVINNNLINLDTTNVIEFPYNNNISISVSSARSKDHSFEYSIISVDSANWNKLEKEKLELSNLLDGDYTISFRTINNFGDVSRIQQLKIKVLPPWYKAKEGFVLYGLLVLLAVLVGYVLHKRKINKEQKLLQFRLKKEHEELLKEKALENDKKIVELKNQSLKNEVTLKSKQLANTAMALVKKNEALLALKKELITNKNNFDNLFSFKKLVRRIDGSIGHEDEWEIFEHNFNQVHDEFFHQLKEKFTELTRKDLKICAYIKMNLSTKEIAPLMNISVRGVETHRYRLKKKLHLNEEESLSTYLINFS